MKYRIGWISPLTRRSGIGTFSNSVLHAFPKIVDDREIDVTVLYVDSSTIYTTGHRAVCIRREEDFRNILDVFDLLIYNIGNNSEHHEPIFELLRVAPGIIICHDYVYQHYFAGRAAQKSPCFTSYAALLRKFSGTRIGPYIRRSQITSSNGHVRYGPWDTDVCTEEPMSEGLLCLGSAVVVHSAFSRLHAERHFDGPILELGMPHDIRAGHGDTDGALAGWERQLVTKSVFELVSFGHIQSSKCIDTMIAAIAGSKKLRQRIRYTIAGFVGDQNYYDELIKTVQAQGLRENVCFESDVTDERLQQLMLRADMFVNLRRPNTEAASLSLVEQLDMGRPVVVIASGCYSEIPGDAALKLSAGVNGPSLAIALERLIDSPKTMVAIGRAGQRFARTWTSQRYAEALAKFALRHQTKLAERGRAVFHGPRKSELPPAEDRWASDLARARSSLIYFDLNILRVDPSLILTMPHHDLCGYTCEVIFGLFHKPRLMRALSRFFARLSACQAYWACVTFALIADATFRDDETAKGRLINGRPCLDPEFWAVIELLPSRQMLTAGALLLARRRPTPEELAHADDEGDASSGRSRLKALLSERSDVFALDLVLWAQDDKSSPMQVDLPVLDNIEVQIGSRPAGLRALDHVDLSGFYPIESDRAWTRGERGLIGLRLDGGSAVVEVTVTPLFAGPDRPNVISLTYLDRVARVEVEAVREVTLCLEVDVAPALANGVVWLALATSNPGTPNSHDRRLLGLSLHTLRVRTQADETVTQRDDAVVSLNDIAARMRVADRPLKVAHASGG